MDEVQLFLHANKHQLGYIMNEASRIWNDYVPGGAFTVGECYTVVKHHGNYDEILSEKNRLIKGIEYLKNNVQDDEAWDYLNHLLQGTEDKAQIHRFK